MDQVYVLEPGSYIRREGEALKVVKGTSVVDVIPASGLKRLTLIGYVSLSGGVLDFLIKNRVETVFMTPTGRFRARLALDEHRHVALRKAQYLSLSNPDFALKTAVIIVGGKIENMARLLLLRGRQYGDRNLRVATARLRAMKAHTRDAANLDALRGLEGTAAKEYFKVFSSLIRKGAFSFTR